MPEIFDEPEVLEAKLKEMGCPYPPDDSRACTWLEGFRYGYAKASDKALESLERLGR